MRTRPTIFVVNKSNGIVTDAALLRSVSAIAGQVNQDFSAQWGRDAIVQMLGAVARNPVPPLAWQVVLVQNEAHAKELGYGDLTKQGKPLALVYCEDAAAAGVDVSQLVSAEILSMLADPSQTGYELKPSTGELVARDVCAPLEDSFYMRQGVKVAAFVFPAYFVEGSEGPWDSLHSLPGPFTASDGGHLAVLDKSSGEVDHGNLSRLARRNRATDADLEQSEPKSDLPPTAPPKGAPPEKPRDWLRERGPSEASKPTAHVFKPPLRQPDRGAAPVEKGKPAIPLRQPLRGTRALEAEQRAAASLHQDSMPSSVRLDEVTSPAGETDGDSSAADDASRAGVGDKSKTPEPKAPEPTPTAPTPKKK